MARRIQLTALALAGVLAGCDASLLANLGRSSDAANQPPGADKLHFEPAALFFDTSFEELFQPKATLSVPIKVVLAQNETPIASLFRLDQDPNRVDFVAQGATLVDGEERVPPYRVETVELSLIAPEVYSPNLKPCRIYAPGFTRTRELLKQVPGRFGTDELGFAVIPSDTTAMRRQYPEQDVAFKSMLTDSHRFVSEKATYSVIDSEAQLDAFLAAFPINVWSGNPPAPVPLPRPTVNFEAETLLVMAFGPQNSGAIRGEIARVQDTGDRLVALPIRWLPAPWYDVTADGGFPVHMVTVSKAHKPVVFAPIYSTWFER